MASTFPLRTRSPSQPGKLVVTGDFWLQLFVLLFHEVLEYLGWRLAIPIHLFLAQVIVGQGIEEFEVRG